MLPPVPGAGGVGYPSAQNRAASTGSLVKAANSIVKATPATLAAEKAARVAHEAKARSAKVKSFLNEYRPDIREEWRKADDQKIGKLRGILAALQEESCETQLLKKMSEDAEVGNDLKEKRQDVGNRLVLCSGQEAEFEKKQEELRQYVMKNFNALKEAESAVKALSEKSREEISECRRLENEIQLLDKDLQEQHIVAETEQKKISRTEKYKRYLEEVVAECKDEFEGDIEVLMNRYVTLRQGHEELCKTKERLDNSLDKVREECTPGSRAQVKMENDKLMWESQLHERQTDLENKRKERETLEAKLNSALKEKKDKDCQVRLIHMAIEQLFTRAVASCRINRLRKAMVDAIDVSAHGDLKTPVRTDPETAKLDAMLTAITERMEDLRSMHDKAKAELKQADSGKPVVVPQEEVDMMSKVTWKKVKDRDPPLQQDSGNNSQLLAAGGQSSSRITRSDDTSAGRYPQGGRGDAVVAEVDAKPPGDTFLTE